MSSSQVIHLSETPRSSIAVASSTSASPTSTANSSGSSGLFSTAGSPALVLAFLAIGIFAGGLLSMLFLRHVRIMRLMRQRQLAIDEAVPPGNQFVMGRRSRRLAFGEKPKLWEYSYRSERENDRGLNKVVVRTFLVTLPKRACPELTQYPVAYCCDGSTTATTPSYPAGSDSSTRIKSPSADKGFWSLGQRPCTHTTATTALGSFPG